MARRFNQILNVLAILGWIIFILFIIKFVI
jgi:hypothetical protein